MVEGLVPENLQGKLSYKKLYDHDIFKMICLSPTLIDIIYLDV